MSGDQTQKEAPTTERTNILAEGSLHSPGPWKLNWTYAGGGCLEDHPELQYVNIHSAKYIEVAPNGLSLTGYVRPADAHLIAAAPDLLALVKQYASECLDCNYGDGPTGKTPEGDPCEWCGDTRALLAKVEGRS